MMNTSMTPIDWGKVVPRQCWSGHLEIARFFVTLSAVMLTKNNILLCNWIFLLFCNVL